MMTPILDIDDAYDAALKIQYSINARSAKLYMNGESKPKYKTESRQWFSLALHRDVNYIKFPYVHLLKVSPNYPSMVEYYADGVMNVCRLLKIFNSLRECKRKYYMWKSYKQRRIHIDVSRAVSDLIAGFMPPEPKKIIRDRPFKFIEYEQFNYEEIREFLKFKTKADGDENLITELLERNGKQCENVETIREAQSFDPKFKKFADERIAALLLLIALGKS